MNALQRSYKIYNFALTVSTLLDTTTSNTMAHCEVKCHSILLLNSKNESMS